MNKTGLFGGTFDPFHLGHQAVITNVIDQLQLDELFILPAANPPQKESVLFSFNQRLDMVKMALSGMDKVIVSDLDSVDGKRSYTIDLISSFKSKYPNREIYFIIGEDNVSQLKTWKNYRMLLDQVKIAVLTRNISDRDQWSKLDYTDRLHFIKMPPIDISSSEIREKIQKNEDFSFLVSEPVYAYIRALKYV
ncbi:MAG TPA: nicotinate (nicotinamide) nucleotide adenylyltransferase [Candidatus Cloacimonadota bacterium]|nr:nicotinate (nicotinamide) nucleotide adenylyltransferase [Candidatus Cloacimonadota bacterium]